MREGRERVVGRSEGSGRRDDEGGERNRTGETERRRVGTSECQGGAGGERDGVGGWGDKTTGWRTRGRTLAEPHPRTHNPDPRLVQGSNPRRCTGYKLNSDRHGGKYGHWSHEETPRRTPGKTANARGAGSTKAPSSEGAEFFSIACTTVPRSPHVPARRVEALQAIPVRTPAHAEPLLVLLLSQQVLRVRGVRVHGRKATPPTRFVCRASPRERRDAAVHRGRVRDAAALKLRLGWNPGHTAGSRALDRGAVCVNEPVEGPAVCALAFNLSYQVGFKTLLQSGAKQPF